MTTYTIVEMWLRARARGLTGQLPAVGYACRQRFPFIPEINKISILHAVVKWHAGLPVKQGYLLSMALFDYQSVEPQEFQGMSGDKTSFG